MADMAMKYDGENMNDESKLKPGFLLGPTAEFPVSPIFAIETGLLFSSKGFKIDEKETYMDETMEWKSKLNLLYLDLPITLKGKINVGDKTNLYVAAGPYMGYGLSGKVKAEYTYDGQTEKDEEDLKFGSNENEDDLKRLDYGLTFGAGVERGHFQFGVNYSLGLANLAVSSDDEYKINNKVMNVSVTYRFIQ